MMTLRSSCELYKGVRSNYIINNFSHTPVRFSVPRSYTTQHYKEVLHVEGEGNNYKLVIPLPTKGPRVFSLPIGQIRSFIDDMKFDDDTVYDVDILDSNDLRLARSMNVTKLLENDWKLRINGITYFVRAPAQSARILSSQPLNQKMVLTFKEWFHSLSLQKEDSIDYKIFLCKCQDFGLSEHQATEIIRELSKVGVIFHFEHNIELERKILLHPDRLIGVIEKALKLELVNLPLSEQQTLLGQLRQEYDNLSKLYHTLSLRAEKSTSLISWTVFLSLCAQWLLFARLTWWEFSWDVIEPVTYFVTVIQTIIAGYVYYLFKRQEYTNTDVKNWLYDVRLRRLARKAKFDVGHYENLKNRITFLETEVSAG